MSGHGRQMMNEIAKFIQTKHIDSFQKLRLLIFLHQHPESSWTSQEIAERLYLGDAPSLEGMIAGLRKAGLVKRAGNRCQMSDEASIRARLQHLVKTCENPLARQEVLDHVRQRTFATARYQGSGQEAR
jgi:predicted transcriptional regulator